jgi:hypothetical protein
MVLWQVSDIAVLCLVSIVNGAYDRVNRVGQARVDVDAPSGLGAETRSKKVESIHIKHCISE